jgi:hypothetical protein
MKKYVKVVLRNRKSFHLPIEKWESILSDNSNLVAYKLEGESEWLGHTINKMEVVHSEYDKDYSENMNRPKYSLYRNRETNTVLKMLDGQLPDDPTKYEKLSTVK